MKKIPKISETEWVVMRTLWSNSPCMASRIIEELGSTTSWKPETVKTMINRLVGKKAIGFDKVGKAYMYYPLVSETECIKSESESFLNRIFGGALNSAIANFIEGKSLSHEEIDELKKILDRNDERGNV